MKLYVNCAMCKKPKCCEEKYYDIYLNESEIRRIASATNKLPTDFSQIFWNPYLKKAIFLLKCPCRFYNKKSGLCSIQKIKPLICKIFPFTLDPIVHSIYIEKFNCKNMHHKETHTLSTVEEVVDINEYSAEVDAWLKEFWSSV